MRPSWDEYFLEIAETVSRRGTCDRKRVGAVLVSPMTRSVLATGYAGSVPGEPHCDDVGHDMVDGHCARTTHAEINAIAQAAAIGTAVRGATLYTNTFPCWVCFKALMTAGIKRIVSADVYRRDERVGKVASALGIEIAVAKTAKELPCHPLREGKILIEKGTYIIYSPKREALPGVVVEVHESGPFRYSIRLDDTTMPGVPLPVLEGELTLESEYVDDQAVIEALKDERDTLLVEVERLRYRVDELDG